MQVYTTIKNGNLAELDGVPSICPFCHNSIYPVELFGYERSPKLDVLFKCPHPGCNESFIGYYIQSAYDYTYYFVGQTTIGNLESKEFSDIIEEISPDFVKIYNQAYQAEQQKLIEICGVGYRKSLEFLIKDYIITCKPKEEAAIKNKLLGLCIREYVDDSKIKSVASRAVWLGNDETHYVRKWEDKDLRDLKRLIDLTVHWIEAEVITKSFEEEMPV